jgi:hypothetical protein
MDRQRMVKALEDLYERALSQNDIPLCLKILQEIVDINKLSQ